MSSHPIHPWSLLFKAHLSILTQNSRCRFIDASSRPLSILLQKAARIMLGVKLGILPTGSEREARPVASPAVEGEDLASTELLLAVVLDHAASDLGQGGAHDFAEIALFDVR